MRRPSDHNPKRNGNERNLRRYAAMAMVMHLDNSGVGPAGALLGYDQYLSAAACARASAAAQPHGGEPALFERIGRALEDLAGQPHVNYQRRRQFFHDDWQIPDDEWALLKSAHPRQNRPWDERRIWFSAHIWTLVTNGDTLLAPMAANKRKESGATLAHDQTRWGQPILGHLNRLASQLASVID